MPLFMVVALPLLLLGLLDFERIMALYSACVFFCVGVVQLCVSCTLLSKLKNDVVLKQIME